MLGRSNSGTPSRARRVNLQGFHFTHEPRETEERQREQENNDVRCNAFLVLGFHATEIGYSSCIAIFVFYAHKYI